MARIDFLAEQHAATRRDYRQRVLEHDKAECAAVAKRYGAEYWDGERRFGYGGYRYDGRWLPLARRLAEHYRLAPGERVLDVGCGKGFLMYELTRAVPGLEVFGIDLSTYALAQGKPEIRPRLAAATARDLPFADRSFDAVLSLGTLHNLPIEDLVRAVGEIERVGRGPRKYIMVESFRTERERVNLLYWQLTCESFLSPDSWAWVLATNGYRGDHGFIFFE